MRSMGHTRFHWVVTALAALLATAACAPAARHDRIGSASRSSSDSAAHASGPFVLFFDMNSAQLSEPAVEILNRACQQQRRTGLRLTITGHADRVGSKLYNTGLSKRRAQAVRNQLVACGVPASMISEKAYGETVGLVLTPDNVSEAQNRRVEIYIR